MVINVGLHTIVGSYDTVLVDVKGVTKSAYFIQVFLKYMAKILSYICITQIVRIHGVHVYIVFE